MNYATYSTAPGKSTQGYRIFEAKDKELGGYHVKYHPIKGTDAFDEYHVVFEEQEATKQVNRKNAYYYFNVEQAPISSKSGTALLAEAKAIAKKFAEKLNTISDDAFEAMKSGVEKEEARVQELAEKQKEKDASTTTAEKVAASKSTLSQGAVGDTYVSPRLRNRQGTSPLPSKPTATTSTARPKSPTQPANARPSAPTGNRTASPGGGSRPTVGANARPANTGGARPTTPTARPTGTRPPNPTPAPRMPAASSAKPWANAPSSVRSPAPTQPKPGSSRPSGKRPGQ